MLTLLAAALVSPAGSAPQRPKPGPILKRPIAIQTLAWLPPFVPLIAEPARTEWREKLLAALNAPKTKGAYVAIPAAKVAGEMAKRKLDPKAQKSTWSTEDVLAIGKATKARFVGRIDVHPISPNVGETKELVAVTCNVLVYDVAAQKAVVNENLYTTGPLPTPGKGTYADGLPIAVKSAETTVPAAVKARLEKL